MESGTTLAPARAVGRPDLGTLRVGGPADIAVFELAEGEFPLFDTHGGARTATNKLATAYTIARGRVFAPAEVAPEPEAEIRKRYTTIAK